MGASIITRTDLGLTSFASLMDFVSCLRSSSSSSDDTVASFSSEDVYLEIAQVLEFYADVAFRKLVSSSDVHYDRYVLVTLFPFFPSRPDDVELFLLVTHFFPNVSIHFVFTLTFKFKFTKKRKEKKFCYYWQIG